MVNVDRIDQQYVTYLFTSAADVSEREWRQRGTPLVISPTPIRWNNFELTREENGHEWARIILAYVEI